MEPIYIPDDLNWAYRLYWDLAIFPTGEIQWPPQWRETLASATELDGVRILDAYTRPAALQFLLSGRPSVAPCDIVRSVKGRLQHLLRRQAPRAFRRNYSVRSVGRNTTDEVIQYVQNQLQHHGWESPQLQERQWYDANVRLDVMRRSRHGEYCNSLHLVLAFDERHEGCGLPVLMKVSELMQRTAKQNSHQLSCIGVLWDHVHVALGCDVKESAEHVALNYMNSLGVDGGLGRIFQHSAYIATCGAYRLGAIWRNQKDRV